MTTGPQVEDKQQKKTKETIEPVVRVSSSISESDKVYRSGGSFYKMLRSKAWGWYLQPTTPPEGLNLSTAEINGIRLHKDFPKIPAEIWSRWIALCFYMCPNTKSEMASSFHNRHLEVQVCLLRNVLPEGGVGTEWKMVIPKQVVSGVSVEAELANNIDIVTGEKYTQFPPQGWTYAGTSHSHNTMGAFFSGTDNISELNCPGFHVVIGNIDHEKHEYTYASSIVMRKMRKDIEIDEVVDTTPMEKEFHEDVLAYIDTVVSANKKLYEKNNSKKVTTNYTLPWSNLERFSQTQPGEFSSTDELDIKDIDSLEDLDLFDLDDNEHFPYHDEVATVVMEALAQGYTISDILGSLRKAKEEYDVFVEDGDEWVMSLKGDSPEDKETGRIDPWDDERRSGPQMAW